MRRIATSMNSAVALYSKMNYGVGRQAALIMAFHFSRQLKSLVFALMGPVPAKNSNNLCKFLCFVIAAIQQQ